MEGVDAFGEGEGVGMRRVPGVVDVDAWRPCLRFDHGGGGGGGGAMRGGWEEAAAGPQEEEGEEEEGAGEYR